MLRTRVFIVKLSSDMGKSATKERKKLSLFDFKE